MLSRLRPLTQISQYYLRLPQVSLTSIKFYSRFSSAHMMAKSDVFRLSDYDCIGFDLDNTLVQYKIQEMVKMEYETLVKFLIETKNYPKCLQDPIDYDFLQKGLILDFAKGNILKLDGAGRIVRASHGTKFMSEDEIEAVYPERRWIVTDEYVANPLETWNGPLAEKMRALLDYFDMSASLIFGRMVDYIDAVRASGEKCDFELWPDILDGLRTMYDRENFRLNKGGYFPEMKANPEKYIHKASADLLKWLQEVSDKKTTFLITGSHVNFANLTATQALGPDWRKYFNFIGCFAKKPGFFTGAKPFVRLDGDLETIALTPDQLELGPIYSQGNWRDMIQLLARHTGKNQPRFLYFGDNIIQDVYTPAKFTKCDTITVCEEMLGEGMKCIEELHQDTILLKSHTWGSYFSHNRKPSFWAELIEKYSKICIPSVETLAKYSFDHEFYTFTESEHKKGFYPEDPVHVE
ncbi:5'-nucleotidase domain-containing protein 1 [Culicoides brevitarsis]|uniref:5'-nucleotidase domain-containing protein 1 n=1 Tax=Culicoides brevitarsis TaxID=469753 RepID=UPI00307BA516